MSVDRYNRRVSTRIKRTTVQKGECRVLTSSRAGDRTPSGQYLPVEMLNVIGHLPTARALKYVARKAGVPRARVNTLYWNPTTGQWWLILNW